MSDFSIKSQMIDCGITDIDASKIISMTADEAYDLLEELLDELKFIRQNTVHAHMSGLVTDYDVSTKMSQELDKLWTRLDDDNADAYYLGKGSHDLVMNHHNDPIARAITICGLLCKGTYDIVKYEPKLSLESAETIEIREPHDAYLELRRVSDDKHMTLYDYSSLEASKLTVAYINTNCRIFRCKDCGRLTYVDRRKDQDMTDRGLKPVQRCYNCIQTRRRECNENDDLDERCINEMWAHF